MHLYFHTNLCVWSYIIYMYVIYSCIIFYFFFIKSSNIASHWPNVSGIKAFFNFNSQSAPAIGYSSRPMRVADFQAVFVLYTAWTVCVCVCLVVKCNMQARETGRWNVMPFGLQEGEGGHLTILYGKKVGWGGGD